MRSRKDSPGFAVMRTTSQSESTRVPPVTDEKSPPASRITGADSPVIAASFTEATPSITSPSSGMMSPASTSTMSPARELRRLDQRAASRCVAARISFFAVMSWRVARSARRLRLAAALGHRLGEVGEQHRDPEPHRYGDDVAGRRFALAEQRLQRRAAW